MTINRGDRVVIKKGTAFRSLKDGKKIAGRTYTVTAHSVLTPLRVSVSEALRYYEDALVKLGADLTLLRKWERDNAPEYYQELVEVTNEEVMWAGTGGYWCYAAIQDVQLA